MESLCGLPWSILVLLIMTMPGTVRSVCDGTSAEGCSSTQSTGSTTDWVYIFSTTTDSLTEVDMLDCDCVNGKCKSSGKNQTLCVCDDNWAGETCNHSCDCLPGETCSLYNNDTVCLQTTTPYVEPEVHDVCNTNYTLRPLSERQCFPGRYCMFGVCRTTETGGFWCECDPFTTGQKCEFTCCNKCVHGTCFYDIDKETSTCNCFANYSGSLCETFDFVETTETPTVPEDPTWHYWVVGSCAFVLVLLICLIVIVPYYLWRHRVILVMKVVHYFQEYEDDDDRQWDVFISYKSSKSDETFVVETLFPKLEKELGFKANVHFRDFVAGETISNNIISAVQGSRRTIMVISPSYVTSEFTKFEYQVAQQEMLKRKHRIIPILLEDISACKETMDPTLKVILGSVTYIEWPKIESEKKLEKFWKRIELSMPKKKNRVLESALPPNTKLAPNTKPSNTNVDLGNKTNPKKVVADGNVYSVIDESKLNKEEVYDTLNESEMLTEVIKKDTQNKVKQNEFLNVLKVDL